MHTLNSKARTSFNCAVMHWIVGAEANIIDGDGCSAETEEACVALRSPELNQIIFVLFVRSKLCTFLTPDLSYMCCRLLGAQGSLSSVAQAAKQGWQQDSKVSYLKLPEGILRKLNTWEMPVYQKRIACITETFMRRVSCF